MSLHNLSDRFIRKGKQTLLYLCDLCIVKFSWISSSIIISTFFLNQQLFQFCNIVCGTQYPWAWTYLNSSHLLMTLNFHLSDSSDFDLSVFKYEVSTLHTSKYVTKFKIAYNVTKRERETNQKHPLPLDL